MGEAAMQGPTPPAAGTHGDEQRQEMLVARMRLPCLRLRRAITYQRVLVSGSDARNQPFLECRGPVRRYLAIDVELPQIVDRAAAGQDQDLFVPQRLQCTADLEVMRRIEMRLDRQLRDGNIGVRVCQQ